MSPPDLLFWARQGAAAALLTAGIVSVLIGAIGILRFPDFYTRLHAARAIEALGVPLILAGLALAAWDWGMALKLALLAGFSAAFGPALLHLLANAAYAGGLAPVSALDAKSRKPPA